MSTTFYRLWLPVSLVCHIAVLLFIRFLPINAADLPRERVITLTFASASAPAKVAPITAPIQHIVKPPPAAPPVVRPKTPPLAAPVLRRGALTKQEIKGTGDRLQGHKIDGKKPAPVGNRGTATTATPAPDHLTGRGPQEVPANTAPHGEGTGGGHGTELEGGGSGEGGVTAAAEEANIVLPSAKTAENGADGWVTLTVNLGLEFGRPLSVDVNASSGDKDLIAASRRAASRSTFRPALRAGKPVHSSIVYTYIYKDGKVSYRKGSY